MVSEQHPELIDDKAWMWSVLVEEIESADRWQELLNGRRLSDLDEAVKVRIPDGVEAKEIEQISAGLSRIVEVGWINKLGKKLELTCMLQVLQQPPTPVSAASERCRTLSIPVDLPSVNVRNDIEISRSLAELPHFQILNAAQLTIPTASTEAIFSGQPLQAILHISTAFHWGSGSTPRDGYPLRFDIDPDVAGNWLISGQRRGEFVAKARSLELNEKCGLFLTERPLRITPRMKPGLHWFHCEMERFSYQKSSSPRLPTTSRTMTALNLHVKRTKSTQQRELTYFLAVPARPTL